MTAEQRVRWRMPPGTVYVGGQANGQFLSRRWSDHARCRAGGSTVPKMSRRRARYEVAA